MTFQRLLTLASLTLPLLATPAKALLQLGAPFGDHMVLQQGVPIDIWGTGAPNGDSVKLSIAGQSVSAVSDWEGRWIVHLAPMKAGGPYQLLIEIGGGALIPSSAANSKGGAELNDVLVGDVVLASPSSRVSAAASANSGESHPYAWVRVYKSSSPGSPTSDAAGHWTFVSSQDIVPPDALFAVGGELYTKRHIPIGVVEASNGPICTDPAACPAPTSNPSEDFQPKSPKGNKTP